MRKGGPNWEHRLAKRSGGWGMGVKLVYLDSSSIVRSYVGERGSEVVDEVYARGETGGSRFVFSIWNMGEVFGVFDRYALRGDAPRGGA